MRGLMYCQRASPYRTIQWMQHHAAYNPCRITSDLTYGVQPQGAGGIIIPHLKSSILLTCGVISVKSNSIHY